MPRILRHGGVCYTTNPQNENIETSVMALAIFLVPRDTAGNPIVPLPTSTQECLRFLAPLETTTSKIG